MVVAAAFNLAVEADVLRLRLLSSLLRFVILYHEITFILKILLHYWKHVWIGVMDVYLWNTKLCRRESKTHSL